jgi:5-methylthioadenosine/S-adenosylhomocysteine deaminase
LIKSGTIVSMDLKVGNLARGDVLIDGTKIKCIASDLSVAPRDGKAAVLDARDTIVPPGFVDPHIHAWERQLGRIIPNWNGVSNDTKHNYFAVSSLHTYHEPIQ